MTPSQWQNTKDLYNAALKCPPNERQRFVDENCGNDEAVRREVESLLANSENAAGFLEQPAVGAVAKVIIGEQERLSIGQTISHYKVIRLLGAGGMGEVYLAEDTRLHRQVALKTLFDHSTSNQDNLERFRREVHSASALNHPNICTIYEVDDHDGIPFVAMEYIPGETLDRKIRAGLDPRQAVDIAVQVADALTEAHAHNIVHRDMKPANILITPRGQAKVLDFGLAKKISAESEDPTQKIISQAGLIIGTASYMSPEQARGAEVDARSDIFSFGIVLYEMIAGKPPFQGENTVDVIGSILHQEPTSLHTTVPEVFPDVERIINKTLRKDREERYQTAKDLLIDLTDVKRAGEFQNKFHGTPWPSREESDGYATAGNAAHTTSSAEYITGEIKKHKFTFLLAAAFIVLAIGAASFWYLSNRPSRKNQIESVAVLPFQNGSGDANLEYLSDGVSESLIDRLSELPDLKVIARSSSFKYRGENIDLRDAANKLGVQALIMGRLVRHGDDLSIRVEMVDARDDRQLWSQQYDRKGVDTFAMEREIARTISDKLRLKLTGAQERLQKAVNPQAYELFLRSRFARVKGGADNLKKAIDYLQQSVSVDPSYALAYAELSFDYTLLGGNSFLNPKEIASQAEAAAQKSLELDENLAEGHVALALIKINAWDWADAERECQRAIELNPNLADAHVIYAGFLSNMGRHEEAIAQATRGRELDPLSFRSSMAYGNAFLLAHRDDEAIESFKKTLELEGGGETHTRSLAYAYLDKGMNEEAVAEMLESIRSDGDDTSAEVYLGAAYARAGNRAKAQSILRQLETSKDYVAPGELAILYATLGDTESAFASLEKAYAAHDLQLQYLNVDSGFDPLRGDPRFKDLVRRVGLPL